MHHNYETPGAVRHDAETLMDDARELLNATADVADEKVVEARRRLSFALDRARVTAQRMQERATELAKRADVAVRDHPYESAAVAFGIGAVAAGIVYALCSRR